MANSVDPDQTAPIGAVCSGFTLFASILSGRHFQMHFFLGALRVKIRMCTFFLISQPKHMLWVFKRTVF